MHSVADPNKRISYAQLIGGRYFDAPVDCNGQLRRRGTVKVRRRR